MKNKRNCKNKYRQNKPEEEENKAECADKHKSKEEVRTESYINNSTEKIPQTATEKKEKEHKPQKRKKAAEDICSESEVQNLKEEKQLTAQEKKTKGGKVEKGAAESSADGHEPEVEITDVRQQLPTKRLQPEPSKEQALKREKLRKMLYGQATKPRESPPEQNNGPAAPGEEVKQDRSASLRSRMEQRLESARFRYINEVLYSTSSGEAKRMFRQDPQAFWIYHRGYTTQVQRWPANPVDGIISYIQQKWENFITAVI